MKSLLIALLVVGAGIASAETRTLTLTLNETQSVQMFGITAAWAIDASIVDASVQQGNVVLFGRAPGRTTVIVTGVTGEHPYEVIVKPRAGTLNAAATAPKRDNGTAEVRYSSAAREVESSVSVSRETKTQRTEAHVRTAHQQKPQGDHAKTSIASASIRLIRRKRELTLLDRDIDHSPLTITSTPLRGVHYLDDHWRLHAGYTAYAAYRSFLIPIERELVAGGGYVFRTGPRSTLTPSLFAIGGEGTIASLLYDYNDPDRLGVRGELGYSGGAIGASAELSFDDENDRVRSAVRYRPEGFATAGTAPRGFFGDASWTREYGNRGSSFAASASATDTAGARIIGASGDLEHRATKVLSFTGGASWADFDGHRAVTIPAGIRLDFARGGVSALYRYSHSHTNRGGHGFRVAGRTTLGRFYTSAYIDRQQNVPTVELIFSERPDLALALAELGIYATTPADVARAMREHAELAELGFIEGITIDLAPMRTQLGFETSWLSAGASRQQIRARVLRNVIESVASRRTTTIATISYARRLTAATDLYASWSYWRTEVRGQEARVQPIAEIGVRQRFDGFPSLFGGDNGTISGVIFVDEDLDGVSDGSGIVGEVELDGKKQKTAANGTFTFNGVAHGTHRVVARVPDAPGAYFTTPSRVEAESGDKLSFGVAITPARLIGTLTSDAGDGIAGVRMLLARGAQRITSTTQSDGGFTVAAPPGEWQLSVVTESVAPGYSLAEIEARPVVLDRDQPARTALVLRAHRTISGRTTPHASVELLPLGMKVRADEQGQFTFRLLPAGAMTLVTDGVEQRVDLPNGPVSLNVDVDRPATVTPVVTASPSPTMTFVDIGVYRVRANATVTAERARAAGVEVIVKETGPLTIVRAGPYASRDDAAKAATRLKGAGLEALIASR